MARRTLLVLLATLLLLGSVACLAKANASAEASDDVDLMAEEAALLNAEDDGGEEADVEELEGSGEPVDEKDVVVLGGKDFAEFIASNQFVLAEFYAPWCGHCQSLTPEYARAATALKDAGVKLAKVDAVEHSDLAQEHGVEGYPTLYFFVDGEKRPYNGGRTSDEIVAWIKKRTGPAVSTIKSAADAAALLESKGPNAIAYLQSVEGADAEEFAAVARLEDGVEFYMTADEKIAKEFGLKKAPALVLLKKHDEKVSTFDGSFEKRAIADFVAENKLPLVIPFNRETASVIFEGDVTRQLLLFATPAEYEKVRAHYEEAAKVFKKKITFVLIDLADEEVATPVLDFFALENEDTKLIGFVSEESSGKYLYEGDFSVDSIKKFSEKFLAGELTPFRKSQSPPEKNDGPVKIVVSSTFEEIVLDKSKDVIFEVYAPWCGHCQSLEPEYNKLGEALKNISTIVIAKMDGTKNEHERINIEGYPTILFYPAGDKTAEPTPLDTERTAAGFIKFLSTHATHKFKAPEVSEPEPETEPELEHEHEDDDQTEEEGEESADEEVKDEL
jgi:protein disulfide-isomerase A1